MLIPLSTKAAPPTHEQLCMGSLRFAEGIISQASKALSFGGSASKPELMTDWEIRFREIMQLASSLHAEIATHVPVTKKQREGVASTLTIEEKATNAGILKNTAEQWEGK